MSESRPMSTDELYRGPVIMQSALFLVYTGIFVTLCARTIRTAYAPQPSNLVSVHSTNVLRGSSMLYSQTLIGIGVVGMYGFTLVSTVCGWCLATSNYSNATAVSNLSTCSLGVVVFLADVILTSRCGTIWMYNIWIIIPPLIGILLEVVLYTLSIWGMASPSAVPIYFNPGLVSAVYFPFISLISTFYCTIVITIRMVQHANRDRRNGVALGTLRATLTIIVESALLYSLTLVADVVAAWKVYQQEAPLVVVMYTTSALLYFAGMCPTWIMMRAMSAPKKDMTPSAKVEIDLTEGELRSMARGSLGGFVGEEI